MLNMKYPNLKVLETPDEKLFSVFSY